MQPVSLRRVQPHWLSCPCWPLLAERRRRGHDWSYVADTSNLKVCGVAERGGDALRDVFRSETTKQVDPTGEFLSLVGCEAIGRCDVAANYREFRGLPFLDVFIHPAIDLALFRNA